MSVFGDGRIRVVSGEFCGSIRGAHRSATQQEGAMSSQKCIAPETALRLTH
jgi:hypothetical protein